MKTVKDFLNELNENNIKVLNYDDFLNELKNTPEKTLKGTLKTNILTPKDGLISVDMFLKNIFSYDNQGHFLSNSEIKELENDTTNYIFDNDLYTANICNFLAQDINIEMFTNDNDNYLLFLQVNTGADVSYGFSSYVALKFNTKKDYENAFIYDSIDYDLASCSLETGDGTTASIRVTSSPFDYPANIYAIDDDTWDEIFITEIDDADFSSIKEEVTDYIKSDKELSKKFHDIEFDGYDGNVYIAN